MAASINAAALITPTHGAAGYADEVIADEFDDMPPQLVPLVIEPMLANRVGALVRSAAEGQRAADLISGRVPPPRP
jgi:hypothetical protein